MWIESAFIADHAEVNPATRTLDVRSGFQSSIRVPKLPFRHVLALALVVQVASDDYGRAFTLGIDVNRVDELPVMLHQDFSFEIPRGIHAADGVSHPCPFAFSLPVDFYDVGLNSVIVGDEDSDVAHVPFRSSYKWSPWTNIDRWSEPRAMGHPLPPSPSSRGCSAISYTRVSPGCRRPGLGP